MASTSAMTPLGSEAPDFTLPDPRSGGKVSLGDFADEQALLVMFLCNHCPYVQHVRHGLADLGRDSEDSDLAIVAISSNDVDRYPDDAPDRLAAEAEALDYRFPYLYDETQDVAKAFGAMCTPDFFLYGPERTLRYRGRFDASRPNMPGPSAEGRVTGDELRAAIDAVLADRPVAEEQFPSVGCGIKWKPGNAPAWAS